MSEKLIPNAEKIAASFGMSTVLTPLSRAAPQAAIAFNHTPHDLADAAARGLRCKV